MVYGEIVSRFGLQIGQKVEAGDLIGWVKQVLKHDKGRPMSMLHIELHKHDTLHSYSWNKEMESAPYGVLDPTPLLIELMNRRIRNKLMNRRIRNE